MAQAWRESTSRTEMARCRMTVRRTRALLKGTRGCALDPVLAAIRILLGPLDFLTP
jgi:hypothetical protein